MVLGGFRQELIVDWCAKRMCLVARYPTGGTRAYFDALACECVEAAAPPAQGEDSAAPSAAQDTPKPAKRERALAVGLRVFSGVCCGNARALASSGHERSRMTATHPESLCLLWTGRRRASARLRESQEEARGTASPAASTPSPEEAPRPGSQPDPAAQGGARQAAFLTFLHDKVCCTSRAKGLCVSLMGYCKRRRIWIRFGITYS